MKRAPLIAALLFLGAVPAGAQDAPPLALRLTVSPQGPVWIGQRVTVTLTAMTPVRFAAPPAFPELVPRGRAIVLPEATTVPGTERVGGQSLAALQRSYELFPTEAGELVLPSMQMEASVGGPSGLPLDAAAAAPEIRLAIRSPPGVPDLTRLAVTPRLRVSAETDRAPDGLRVGEAITRTLHIEAEDTAAMLLPIAPWGRPEGVAVYPDPPVLRDRMDRGVLRAVREERAAFVPQRPGLVELPGFFIAWFDPRASQLHEVRVEALRFLVLPADAKPAEAPASSHPSWLWLAMAAALALAAGGLLTAWRRRNPPEPEKAAFTALAAACRAGEPRGAITALFRWCDAALPQGSRQDGLACLAAQARSPDLAAEARVLEAYLYGAHPSRGAWNGTNLLAAARRARHRLHRPARHAPAAALPSLNPGGATVAPPRVVRRNWAR